MLCILRFCRCLKIRRRFARTFTTAAAAVSICRQLSFRCLLTLKRSADVASVIRRPTRQSPERNTRNTLTYCRMSPCPWVWVSWVDLWRILLGQGYTNMGGPNMRMFWGLISPVRERILYSIRSLTFSQWRDLRVGVIWENLGVLTTTLNRKVCTWWSHWKHWARQ